MHQGNSIVTLGLRKGNDYNRNVMNPNNQTNPKKVFLRTVHISHLDRKGVGVGKTHTGGELKVPYTLPGELVEAQKLRRRDGRLLQVTEPSLHRIEPDCCHFSDCGGCSWQHIDYAYQLQLKRERVADRLREFDFPIRAENLEIDASEPFAYRNRMDFLWWFNGDFGLRRRGKWYSAVNLHECHLLPKSVMDVALEVNRRVQKMGFTFRDSKNHTGGLRYLIIRHGVFTQNIMLSFVSDPMPIPASLWDGLDEVISVYQLINDNAENDLSDGEAVHLWGEPYYYEKIGSHKFCVGPRSFFQPNPAVATRMVSHLRDGVSSLDSRKGLIDLYCGIGLFTISLADCFEKGMGIENNPEAIALAKRNAWGLSGRSPVHFVCMDAEKWDWERLQNYDTLLIDPPRTGLHDSVLALLKRRPFPQLIYVSCNPTRGIADLAQLQEVYELASMKLFDQFPQTPHVEFIAFLRRK